MHTKIVSLDPTSFRSADLQEAALLLQQEEVIGFPTETVYGLGGSALSEKAVRKIFQAKGRPADNPLIVHISNMDMLQDLVEDISPEVKKLCKRYWPGPLTILFQKSDKIPSIVTAGLSTVAIRMPSHPIALALIDVCGLPIAAPSANLSGRPSPTTADHVFHDLEGKIPLIIDGGACQVGVESTVIDVNRQPPMILRPGGMNYEDLQQLIPDLLIYEKVTPEAELEAHPSTPGLKYTHYSPRAKVTLLIESPGNMASALSKAYHSIRQEYSEYHIGILHTHGNFMISQYILDDPHCSIHSLVRSLKGESKAQSKMPIIDPRRVAQGLFAGLRALDALGADLIIVEGIPEQAEGLAVMNRLRKAASFIIPN